MSANLEGNRVVVTRAAHQAAELCTLLEAHGAQALQYPCIQIVPPDQLEPLDEALWKVSRAAFDGLVLTSVNTVGAILKRLHHLRLEPSIFRSMWVACIGPATAEAARNKLGVEVRLIPDEYIAECLIASIRPRPNECILLPRADIARSVLAEGLEQAGAHVTLVTAYSTKAATGGVELPGLVKNRQVDAITLSSSSTARFFVKRFISEGGSLSDLDGVCIACIGPVTAEAAAREGLQVHVMARVYTITGLVTALEIHFIDKRNKS